MVPVATEKLITSWASNGATRRSMQANKGEIQGRSWQFVGFFTPRAIGIESTFDRCQDFAELRTSHSYERRSPYSPMVVFGMDVQITINFHWRIAAVGTRRFFEIERAAQKLQKP